MQNSIEVKSIDNIIEKLQLHMQRNNQTMHGLASSMGFDYQPFYRLMTKKSLPTVSSLDHIASKLNCSISELIADDVFLNVASFDSIKNYLADKSSNLIRVYVRGEILQDAEECIAIKTGINSTEYCLNNIPYSLNTNVYQLFTVTSRINIDGFFLVKYKNEITMLEVINISSKLITAKYNGKIIQIPVENLIPYAKFITYIELPNQFQNTAYGKIIQENNRM
jgi:transcriptional regulator with XRE-family HTH domain